MAAAKDGIRRNPSKQTMQTIAGSKFSEPKISGKKLGSVRNTVELLYRFVFPLYTQMYSKRDDEAKNFTSVRLKF